MSNATFGVVQIQNGTYVVDASTTLNNETSLEGFGNDTVLKLGDGVNSEILQIANNSHDISVSNMELDGNRANQNTGTWLVDCTGTSQRITLAGLNIHDSYRTGILLGESQNSTIENCLIHDCGRPDGTAGDAANCFGGSDITFRGNICYNYVDSAFAFQGSRASITNNTCVGGWSGVYFGTQIGTNDSVCFNNTFLSNNVTGVNIDTASFNDTVSDNIIEGCRTGVMISGATNCTVSGNTISGSISLYAASIQFYAPASSLIEVSGNSISNGAWDGIRFINSSSVGRAIDIWNNTVTGSRYGINTDPLTGNVMGITIRDNYLYRNNASGIYLARALNCTAEGNTCLDNSQSSAGTYDGITLWGDNSSPSEFNIVTNNTCTDNQITKTQNYGVREMKFSDYNVITNNGLRGNIQNSVAIAGLHTIVENNIFDSVSILPVSANLDVGQSQLFAATVSGETSLVTYAWYLNNAVVSGATDPSWTFTPSFPGSYTVYVKATDNVGVSLQSNFASVTVNPALSVSVSPLSVNLDVGQSQNCTATVSNGTFPYSYQWYFNGTAVSGVTSDSWTFTPTSPGSYMVYVEATDSVGVQAMSNTATVTVSTVVKLSVSSAHDNPKPSNGVSPYTFGSLVTCNVTSPVIESGTGWKCTGWKGTGSVPPIGNFSSVTFMITEDSSITWNWQILPALVNSLTASPNPFSPNGDGTKDTSMITATFNVAVIWNLQVSSSGTALRTWTGTGNSVSIVWNGKNSSGFRVPDGTYTVRLSGVDMSGVSFTTTSVTLTIDTKRPTATSVSVSPTSFHPRSGQTTKIAYTLSESCYVTITVYNSAGTLVRTLVNNVLQSSGAQSVTWNGKTGSGTVVPAGTYTIRIYVTDKAGNKATPYPTTKTVKVN